MLCLQRLANFCLFSTAATLSCVSVGLFSMGDGLNTQNTITIHDASHRGSGRLATETLESGSAIASADSKFLPVHKDGSVSHRGSGRADDGTHNSKELSYRGTGRISTDMEVAYRGTGRFSTDNAEPISST